MWSTLNTLVPWEHQRQWPEETESACLDKAFNAPPYLSPLRWGCSTPPVSQYHYHMAASFWSSLRAGRKKLILLARPAIKSCWRSHESTGYQMLPSTASQKQWAPLIERVRLRQLRFLGHVLRLPENEPFRQFEMYVPTHGRRKLGRQRTLFTNYIHCLLGDPDGLLNDNQLLEITQDWSAAEKWWWSNKLRIKNIANGK